MSPFRHRDFRWYFAGRSVSVLGSAMTPVALAFAVLEMTDDPKYLGYVLASAMIPMTVLLLVGGGVADRLRQDRLLTVTNVGAGLAQAGIAFCVLSHKSVWFLIPLGFVNGVLQAFTGPAMQGIVPKLVPAEELQKANSLLASARNAAQILGPTVAGVLVATIGGGWGIAADSVSFFVSAACLATLSLPERPKKAGSSLLRELGAGWTYFRSTRWLWPVSLAFTVLNIIQMGVWQVLGPVMAKQSIGAGSWGMVLSTRAVGLLLMSTLLIRMTVKRPLISVLLWFPVSAAPLVLLGLRAGTPELAAGAFVQGLGFAFMGVVWDTVRHTHIPPDMMSRATSFDDLGSWVAIPVGQLSVLPLAAVAGATRVALVGGVVYAAVGLLPLTVGAVRRLGSAAPTEAEAQAGTAAETDTDPAAATV
jgi:MFS family permease